MQASRCSRRHDLIFILMNLTNTEYEQPSTLAYTHHATALCFFVATDLVPKRQSEMHSLSQEVGESPYASTLDAIA